MSAFTESVVEQAALAWFEALGYTITGGPTIAPGEPDQERRTYADVVLDGRLREALARLNPTVSREDLDEAFRKLTRISSPQPIDANREKMAGYHQFHAVGRALDATLSASRPQGDRRVGVVWHTQGSGKSLTMAFYAGRVVLHPAMRNPTLIVLNDRNDLDEQLFCTFARCKDILRQSPEQARDRGHLRELLKVASGGVVFTTIQKFMPETRGGDTFPLLSARSNIVLVADEAHRGQYDFIDGFARHMRDALPNASFIGFTGTPIDAADQNTRSAFGDYVSVYDIQRAVEDGATVPIYYESRLAKLELKEEERPHLDEAFDELTEGEELEGLLRLSVGPVESALL